MQKLVDVLDVCERLNIPKNINTETVFETAQQVQDTGEGA